MLILFLVSGFLLIPILKSASRRFSIHPANLLMIYPVMGLVIGLYATISRDSLSSTINWVPSLDLNISFHLSNLSMIFFMLISFIGILVTLYARYYMPESTEIRFYMSLLLFMIAMFGVVTASNTIMLYLFWELTSIASFLLISYQYERSASTSGAMKSLMITVTGGMLMFTGFIALYIITGTFSIDAMYQHHFESSPLFVFAMIAIIIGALTKSAQFPFHSWLPAAMAAPTPVSSYLHSATMVKAGLYLMLLFIPVFSQDAWFSWILLSAGLLTMVFGSLTAIFQHDLKALLAYSTISQLGMMFLMIGMLGFGLFSKNELMSSIAYTAILFYIISHACFKASLFMLTGIIDHQVHTRSLHQLGGLRHVYPGMFVLFSISSLAMAGVPLLSGFLGKEMLLTSLTLLNIPVFTLIAVISSIFTFIYCIRIIKEVFFGPLNVDAEPIQHRAIYISPFILSVLTVLLFIFPNAVASLWIVPNLTDLKLHTYHISAWHGFNIELIMTSVIFFVGILGVLLLRERFILKSHELPSINLKSTAGNMFNHVQSQIPRYMSDRIDHSLIFLFTIVLIISGPVIFLLLRSLGTIPMEMDIFSLLLTLLIVIACFNVICAKTRVTAIIFTGLIGYGISLIYVLLFAPDLALTQIVIETITTILFLSAFHHLPQMKRERKKRSSRFVTLIISLAMSLFVMALLLIANDTMLFTSISAYYDDAYELTGGKNIVNAILGDFRAFDTLMEGFVLLITGLGIYMLIKKPIKKEVIENERK